MLRLIDLKLYYDGDFLLCDVILYQMHVQYQKKLVAERKRDGTKAYPT